MDGKVLHEIFSSVWFIEGRAASQWHTVINELFLNGASYNDAVRSAGIGFSDTRSEFPSSFFKVDSQGRFDVNGPVQVIVVSGVLMRNDYCGAPGSNSIVNALHAAYDDKSVKGIVLVSDCPGGSAACSEPLDNAIAKRNKPVATFVNNMMCSAIYWGASGSDTIIASNSNKGHMAMVGCIGTLARFVDTSKADEAKGYVVHEIYATESTEKNEEFRKIFAGDHEEFRKNRVDPINKTFLDAVRKNRPGVKEEALKGKTYDGKEAKKVGLVDSLGTFADAVRFVLPSATNNNKSSKNMNKNAFQNVLVAAGAEALEVVEGGFLATEDHLNAIDAKLAEQDKTIARQNDANDALAEQNKTLKAAAEKAATADDLQAKLEAAEKRATDAEAKATELQGQLKTAMEHGKTYDAAAKSFFGVTPNAGEAEGGNGGKKVKSSLDEAADAYGL